MTQPNCRNQRGQVLPLFAFFLIALFGVAALAIDVSGALAARRAYRSAADGAALAGAQDLQVPGTRAVNAAERIKARQHAMDHLVSHLGITGTLPGACDTAVDVDVTDACVLPGTSYHVSIRAGTATGPTAIACQNCDPSRSVQVGLRNASYDLSFARVFGQNTWSVGVTSVAGLAFSKSYAVVMLRPPKENGATFLVNDIIVAGNSTVVNVYHGDVGTNANMAYSGSGAVLNIDPGYGMFYFDPIFAPRWYTSPPYPPAQLVQQLPTLIPDPNYNYPAMSGSLGTAPTFDDARTGEYLTLPAVERGDEPGCAAELANVDPSRYDFISSYTPDKVFCFEPGIYLSGSGVKDATISIGTDQVGLLKPGAYYLKSGLDVGGNGSRLLGGYAGGQPGVALMFDECANQCTFSGNSADTIALNAGTEFPRGASGSPATAAIDWNNQLVQTSGPSSPTPPILMSLLVIKDPTCYVPTSPPFQEPAGCDPHAPTNHAISIAGGGQLHIAGVQYLPTDNVVISGSSDGMGTVGQIIAWTVEYKGDTTLNQDGAGSQGPGTLRLDGACTAPGTPCNP